VTAYHVLKLFQNDPRVIAGEIPLVNEYYDELVIFEIFMVYLFLGVPRTNIPDASRTRTSWRQKVRSRQTSYRL
jgi:hypothetical protein